MPLADGNHAPPLKSEDVHMGFPWITGVLGDKLHPVNAIYNSLAAFCFWFSTPDTDGALR